MAEFISAIHDFDTLKVYEKVVDARHEVGHDARRVS
jgi:hypothetical protein